MKPYDPSKIELKWQKKWEKEKLFQANSKSKKPKYYALVEFPYPSGDGLHVGHIRSYTALDALARKKRMEGFNVLYPMGWDAFGLPAESYAIKTGIHPEITTKKNIKTFKNQMRSVGLTFDWSREVNTTDPKYYKWTQWIFLKFLEKGLAYKDKAVINWCPKDKIGLANEEVVDGCCERCGTPVEKREKEQWMLAITKYADRLDKDLDTVDYSPRIKTQQRNWIGRSEGVEISFQLSGVIPQKEIKVFTTRPDTIFGATFLAVSAELAQKWIGVEWSASPEIKRYIKNTLEERAKAGFEEKEKTGISSGFSAINPATKKEIPVWIVNYVLPDVGTGAIMGVPADDERDRKFAEKFNLPIVDEYKKAEFEDFGKKITRYKLRDWIFSRQRYWGEPIPVIHCEKCGIVPVPVEDLPVKLPKVKKYEYTSTGESPLAGISKWVNVKCPKCGGKAKRETDTMPNWAGSSWYFMRYTDPDNDKEFAGKEALEYWMGDSAPRRNAPRDDSALGGIDWYNGGMEHTTLHLLYSRFWYKFLFDLKLVPTSEPYKKRTSHGLILAEGGSKMSKSSGKVVNPDEIIKTFGADALRLYEMFIGSFEQSVSWSSDGIVGPRRFLERIWRIGQRITSDEKGITSDSKKQIESILNKTVKKVSEDIENMGYNTAVSALMVCVNEIEKREKISKNHFEIFLKILNPFAPHIAEELWSLLGNKKSIQNEEWPTYDASKVSDGLVRIAIQVNGKLRSTLDIIQSETEESIKKRAIEIPLVKKWVGDNEVKRVIYVKNRLVNIVV
jgi:leucyl-tRNA synthetase